MIDLEKRNGKKQIPIPGAAASTKSTKTVQTSTTQVQQNKQENAADAKSTKEKKPKKEKAAPAPAANAATNQNDDAPVDIGRIDLRIGKIVEIQKHPDADSLYVEQIDVGRRKTTYNRIRFG